MELLVSTEDLDLGARAPEDPEARVPGAAEPEGRLEGLHLRAALVDLPDWRARRDGRALRLLAQAEGDSAQRGLGGFSLRATARAMRTGLLLEAKTSPGRFTLVLMDPRAVGISRAVLRLAAALSQLARQRGVAVLTRQVPPRSSGRRRSGRGARGGGL